MTGSSVGAVTWDELYDEAARERLVDEPTKRVDAPERTPFERDRARVVHLIIGVGAQQAQDLLTVVPGQAAGGVVDDPVRVASIAQCGDEESSKPDEHWLDKKWAAIVCTSHPSQSVGARHCSSLSPSRKSAKISRFWVRRLTTS